MNEGDRSTVGRTRAHSVSRGLVSWRRGREGAMLLLGFFFDLCCGRVLHREDYDFAANVDEKTGEVLREPSQFWVMGFRDRRLEREYLDFQASRSMGRLGLGYVGINLCVYLLVLVTISLGWNVQVHPEVREAFLPGMTPFYPDGLKTLVIALAITTVIMLPCWLGLIGSLVVYYLKRIQQKRWMFVVGEVVLLVYILLIIGLVLGFRHNGTPDSTYVKADALSAVIDGTATQAQEDMVYEDVSTATATAYGKNFKLGTSVTSLFIIVTFVLALGLPFCAVAIPFLFLLIIGVLTAAGTDRLYACESFARKTSPRNVRAQTCGTCSCTQLTNTYGALCLENVDACRL